MIRYLRSNNFNGEEFVRQITHLITINKPYLVFTDFNINALRDLLLLDTMRQYGYILLGSEPADIMDGLLDHVYIRNNANILGKVRLQTQSVFYLAHDSITVNCSI